MTDMRERVARAICESEMGLEMLDAMPNTAPRYYSAADAAILACGYAEMRKALKYAATAYEDLHDFANDSVCKWSDETQKHCPGVCDYIGCLATHIKDARSILERTGEK